MKNLKKSAPDVNVEPRTCYIMTKQMDRQSLEVKQYYKSRKRQIDGRLKLLVDQTNVVGFGNFSKALRHTILADGKRIRPMLTIAIYELFRDDNKRALNAACALEFIHAGSLMLDDLPCMDNASLRRGKATSHLLFGESTTILASAMLWVRAYDIISSNEYKNYGILASETSKITGMQGLIVGQFYDLEAQHKRYSIRQLTHHYELKTASIFRLSVKYGAILGGASDDQLRHLDKYALHLGIAFQIHDDIIDATSTAKESGKDAHLDEINNTQNYVNTIGLESSKEAYIKHLQASTRALMATGLQYQKILDFTDQLLKRNSS